MTFKIFLSEYALKNKTEIDLKILKKQLHKENTMQNFSFQMKIKKRCKCRIKSLKNLIKDYFQSFKTLLQNYTQKRNTEINQKILKKLLYNDNTIVILYFSNDTGEKVPVKTLKNDFNLSKHIYKTILIKTTLKSTKNLKRYCTKTTLLQNFTFQMKLEKRCKCRIRIFKKQILKNDFETYIKCLQNYTQKINTEIDKKIKSHCTKKNLLLQNFSFQMKIEKRCKRRIKIF